MIEGVRKTDPKLEVYARLVTSLAGYYWYVLPMLEVEEGRREGCGGKCGVVNSTRISTTKSGHVDETRCVGFHTNVLHTY
jgi:hypothetical protein